MKCIRKIAFGSVVAICIMVAGPNAFAGRNDTVNYLLSASNKQAQVTYHGGVASLYTAYLYALSAYYDLYYAWLYAPCGSYMKLYAGHAYSN